MKGSGEGVLPGRLRPGMAEREATGTYSRRSWKHTLPRAPGTEPGQSIVQIPNKSPAGTAPAGLGRAERRRIACKQAPTGGGGDTDVDHT